MTEWRIVFRIDDSDDERMFLHAENVTFAALNALERIRREYPQDELEFFAVAKEEQCSKS